MYCAEAGLVDKAVVDPLKAGKHAMARSGNDGVGCPVAEGVGGAGQPAGGARRRQQELGLRVALA